MRLQSLTLKLTNACNLNCPYCCQHRDSTVLSKETLRLFLNFVCPFLCNRKAVNFYGGEPLLEWELIRLAVARALNCTSCGTSPPLFSITTNGTLLDRTRAAFLNRHKFHVLLSAHQEKQTDDALCLLRDLPDLELEINMVLTPDNVGRMNEKIKYLLKKGATSITLSPDISVPWNEDRLHELERSLRLLRPLLAEYEQAIGHCPVAELRPTVSPSGLFGCSAAKDRLALEPDGTIWGCFRFGDYFNDPAQVRMNRQHYNFGNAEDFIKDFPATYLRTLPAYSGLNQRSFCTRKKFCMDCADLMKCAVCPVPVGNSSHTVGLLAESVCRIGKIFRNARRQKGT